MIFMVIIKISHFADFEQFIIKISHFADFEQVKQYYQQNSLVTGTPPWLLRPVKASTSSELYSDTRLFFLMHRRPVF